MYDQTKQKYTSHACTIYSLLSIMKYNFGIQVEDTFILKACDYFERIGKWIPFKGAVFSVIYKAFVNELNTRTGLNFKLVTRQITSISNSDTNCYGIGMPKYNKKLKEAMSDGLVDESDINKVKDYGKGVGHNLIWDGSAAGYMINTNGDLPCQCRLETLKYGVSQGVFWDNIRTIEPATSYTEKIITLTRQMARAERYGTLDAWLETNKSKELIDDAKLLFFKGR